MMFKKFVSLATLTIVSESVAIYSINGSIGGQPENDFGNEEITVGNAALGILLSLILFILSAKSKKIKYTVASIILFIASCISAFYVFFIAGWSQNFLG